MQVLAIFSTSITIVLYFFLSLLAPFLAYLVPYYKIKKVNFREKKYRLFVNLFVVAILTIINIKLVAVYLVIPVMMEFMFYLTDAFKNKIKTYDRAIFMSLLSTIIISYYINKVNLDVGTLKSLLSSEHININFMEIVSTFNYFKANILYSTFSYFFIGSLLLIFSLDKDTYSTWKISPYWLLIFLGIIFSSKVMNLDINSNFWARNLIEMVKCVYIWYCMKFIYNLCSFTKVKIFKHLISLMFVISYPTFAFVLGALASFDIVEIEDIKSKNNKI